MERGTEAQQFYYLLTDQEGDTHGDKSKKEIINTAYFYHFVWNYFSCGDSQLHSSGRTV